MFLLDIGDTFVTGGITAGLGLSVTFLVLVTLILLVTLVSKVEKLGLKALIAKVFKKNQKEVGLDVVSEPTAVEGSDDNQKLVAAITAAISVVLESENIEGAPKASFIVKSIKRI